MKKEKRGGRRNKENCMNHTIDSVVLKEKIPNTVKNTVQRW